MINEKVSSYINAHLTPDLLLHLNLSLASCREFNRNMSSALRLLGEISQHDRIHILEVHPNMTYTITHEWCCTDLTPMAEKFRHNRIFHDPMLAQQLCERNYLTIYATDSGLSQGIYELLQEFHCHQMLMLPLFGSGTQFAFMVFLQCKRTHPWEEEEIRVLNYLSAILAVQIDNYRLLNRLVKQVKRAKREKKSDKLFHTHIQQLHQTFIPVWEQIKASVSASGSEQTLSSIEELNRHFTRFEEICRTIPEK